jgi:hypothetical protein
MRTLLPAAALAGLLLAVTAPVGQGAPSQDSVTGKARHLGADPPYPVIQVGVNAFSGATGLNPRGGMTVDAEGLHSYTGRVTCLSVSGNQATIGIEITKSSNPSFVGQGELWSIVDTTGGPDRIAGYEITPSPPVLCPYLSFNVEIVSGNYIIHDG